MNQATVVTDVVRSRLIARRSELVERRDRAAADRAHRREPLVADFADQAVQRQNDETLEGILGSMDAEIADIDAALRRLADGHYEECERCGAPIGAARHAALPQATRCPACA